jgi:hypothetical protein
MNRKKLFRQNYLALILLILPSILRAESARLDTLRSSGDIVQLCNFNFDCFKDTLIGTSINNEFKPLAIIWGKDSASSDTSKYSEFIYPQWKNLNVIRYSININYDTVKDFIFIISGDKKVPDTSNIGDSVYKHFCKKVLLFGQNQLLNQSQIRFEEIDSLQKAPYYAMNLVENNGLNNPDSRDYTKRKSYFLPRMNINVNPSDTSSSQKKAELEETLATYKDFAISVNPNPASTLLKITSQSGIKQIEISNLLGEKILVKDFLSGITSSFDLDISGVNTGLYIIKVIDSKYGLSQITNIIIEH